MKKIISCFAITVLLFACSKTETDFQTTDSPNNLSAKAKPGGGGNFSPTVTTDNASNISRFNAIAGGNVSKSGGGNNTSEKGVCYNTSPSPTTANNKVTAGSGYGSFTCTLSGLSPTTLYYVRAYATSGSTTVYGNQVSFTTLATNCGIAGTVQDIDGNVYTAITIGSQVWMLENLKTTHYRNGEPITHQPDASWYDFTTGAYCNYNNDESYVATYGRLYNWYAVNESRNLAPPGWHVATGDDWTALLNYFGGMYVAAGNLKESGTEHWLDLNVAYLNDCGFDALPGGYRSGSVTDGLTGMGCWWSSTEYPGTSNAKYIKMFNDLQNTMGSFGSGDSGGWNDKQHGYSVRCVQDQ
jgi:uncharacterized protein (TIGR02145 family)